MKVVILAGGRGTRLAEETAAIPKPMVTIGGRPILWHIMRRYAHFGLTDFVICLGYRGYVIKEYFANYVLHQRDLTVDLGANSITYHEGPADNWRVTLVDTGAETQTGGRLKRIRHHLGDASFCLTYGDGLADIDIAASIAFHRARDLLATVTVVRPPGRFGAVTLAGDSVASFAEKPTEGHINGGFFVLEPAALDSIEDDATVWEQEPLQHLTRIGQLAAWRHEGFWQPMDTLRDRMTLEALWQQGQAPWQCWA